MVRVRIAALLVLLSCGHGWAEPVDCPFGLSEVIDLAEDQLETLYATRQVIRPYGIETPPSEFVNAMEFYLGVSQSADSTGGNSSVAYIVRGEEVCVVYSRYDRYRDDFPMVDMILLEKTATEISSLIDRNMDEFILSGAPAERAPVLRDPKTRAATALTRNQPAYQRPTEVILAEIADVLFPARFFRGIERGDSLSIVPALNMGRVPFAALDLDGDGRPLLENVVINIEASLKSVLDGNIMGWSPGLESPVVFGDPDATDDEEWILPRLPGARREAEIVSKTMGIEPVLGSRATKERLLDAIGQADYVHLAAHGLASEIEPMDNGFLALTSGRLTAREIQHLDLEGRPVVVLSACQSALGGPLHAGIIGVTRAFQIAGAATVISSLWNIDDRATTDIMTVFAKEVLVTSPPEALRRAQLAGREKWPDPRIWSAFIVFGGRVVDQQ